MHSVAESSPSIDKSCKLVDKYFPASAVVESISQKIITFLMLYIRYDIFPFILASFLLRMDACRLLDCLIYSC